MSGLPAINRKGLKNFRIPLVPNQAGLKPIKLESSEYQEIEKIVLERRSHAILGRRVLNLGDAHLIINRESERRFREKRQSSNNPNLKPNNAFLCFNTLEDARRVGEEGLKHGNLADCAMARASDGVSLCIYSDVLKRGAMKRKEQGWLMLVQWLPCRMYGFWNPGDWPSNIQPPPEYDTLIMPTKDRKEEIARLKLSNSLTPERIFDLSQLFVHSEDGRPATLLPHAIVAFECLELLPVELRASEQPRGKFRRARQHFEEVLELFTKTLEQPSEPENIHGRFAYSLYLKVKSEKERNTRREKACRVTHSAHEGLHFVRSSNIRFGTKVKPGLPQQQQQQQERPVRTDGLNNYKGALALRLLLEPAKLDLSAFCPAANPSDSEPASTIEQSPVCNEFSFSGNVFVCTPPRLSTTPYQFSLSNFDFSVCIGYQVADRILHRSWFVPGWHARAGHVVHSRSRSFVIDYGVIIPDVSTPKDALSKAVDYLLKSQFILLTVLQHNLLAFAIPDSQYSRLLELPVRAIDTPYLHLVILRRNPSIYIPLCSSESSFAPQTVAMSPGLAKIVSDSAVKQFGLRSLFQHALERQRPIDKAQWFTWVSGRPCSRLYDYKKNAFLVMSVKFKQLIRSGRRIQSFDQLQAVFGGAQENADLERDRLDAADLACRTEEQLRIGADEARAFFAEYEKALLGDSLEKTPDFGYDQEQLTLQCTAPLDENESDTDFDDETSVTDVKLFTDDVFLQLAELLDTDTFPNSPCRMDPKNCTEIQSEAKVKVNDLLGSTLQDCADVVNVNRLLRSSASGHVRKPVYRYLRSLPHCIRVCARILAELTLRRNMLHTQLAEELQLPLPFSQLVAIENSQTTEISCGIDDSGPVEFGSLSLRNALLYVLRHRDARVKTVQKTDPDDFFSNYEPFYTDLIDPEVDVSVLYA